MSRLTPFVLDRFSTRRITLFLAPIFFIFVADATMSYTFPIIVERDLMSNTLLGLVMASSSVAGILCDITFPGLLRRRGWGFQFILGAALALLFPVAIHLSVFFAPAFFAVFGAVVWGIYYELLQFSEQGMVTEEEAPHEYARTWSIIYMVSLMTTIVGPVLGAALLLRPVIDHTATVLILQGMALILATVIVTKMKSRSAIDTTCTGPRCKSAFSDMADIVNSARSWALLIGAVFPAILMGVMTKWVEATYWTLGGLFGQSVDGSAFGWLVIIFYEVPLFLGAFLLAGRRIRAHKKRLSQIALIIGGALLTCTILAEHDPLLLYTIIGLSSFAFSFAYPLNDAIYSDIIDRLEVGKLQLIGLAKANSSIAYIAAPIVMGIMADYAGYYATFSTLGIMATLVGVLLLFVTPRKLRLPQAGLASLK